jgi:O-antigen biosynthesis protein
VITPTHNPQFLADAWKSLQAQTHQNFAWYILVGTGVPLESFSNEMTRDPRVHLRLLGGVLTESRIGALKAILCEAVQEEWIVELDHDDLLHPTALAEVLAEADNADFIYSDFAEFLDQGCSIQAIWDNYPYSVEYGWSSYEVECPYKLKPTADDTAHLHAMRAPAVTPQNLRSIWWAPNHLRAWRTSFYRQVGGHNENFAVGDDFDLTVRMYLAKARFTHIPKCLYYYRVHAQNTVKTHNQAIQTASAIVYNSSIWALAEKFAEDNNLAKIDLCGGLDCPPKYTPIDRYPSVGGIVCDLDGPWNLEANSVGVLRAQDAVEHLKNPIHTMNQAWRILAPGGFFMINVPSTNGKGAFCDPTHVSFWNDLSFRYYTDKNFAKYVPEFVGKFQLLRCIEWFPSEWHATNNVPYVEVHLVKLGDAWNTDMRYVPMGAVGWT